MLSAELKHELDAMTCAEVMRSLADFLNGRVSAEQAQHMRWHLSHCHECGFVVRRARQTLKNILKAARQRDSQSSHAA